jgi:hypothetical protein
MQGHKYDVFLVVGSKLLAEANLVGQQIAAFCLEKKYDILPQLLRRYSHAHDLM